MPIRSVTSTVSLVALSFLGVLGTGIGSGCDPGAPDDVASNQDAVPTFEEFLATTYQEPEEGGVYIVNGDETVPNLKQLREFYDRVHATPGALIVHAPGGVVAKWNATQRKNLTFCISNSFGSRKNAVLQAMTSATEAWEAAGDVLFVYASSQDANCTAQNGNVVFDIRPTSNKPYLARAFFPNQARAQRNVLIDSTAFGNLGAITLTGILRHELGHTLGFRHEHTRPEAGKCFEDNSWVALTPYDRASVMHYPQCNGTGVDLSLTARDRSGIASLYGAPGGGGGGNPPPPSGGTPKQGTSSGTLVAGQEVDYQPIAVTPGTRFTADMTGTGDADLYVRFGAAPTATQFDCRPYLEGSNESCALDVPANATSAFIIVDGYAAATFTLNVSWTGP